MRGRRAGAPARARLAAVAPRKTSARKKTRRTTTPSRTRTRKRLVPRKEKRGLEAADLHLELDGPEVAALVTEVEDAGGVALGAYREPLSGRPLLLASLPAAALAQEKPEAAVVEEDLGDGFRSVSVNGGPPAIIDDETGLILKEIKGMPAIVDEEAGEIGRAYV